MLRLFTAILIGFCVGLAFHQTLSYEQEVAKYGFPMKKHRGRETVVWISPLYLPVFFISLFSLLGILRGFSVAADFLEEFLLELMVTLLIYYIVLLLILPLLRRVISARACATLWLLPVFLYWMRQLWINNYIEPLLILRIPPIIRKPLAIVWITGMAAVTVWRITSHLLFRKAILKHARPIGINDTSRLWEREQERIERKKSIPLLISPDAASPMTIGVFGWSMRTVLPDKAYNLEELELIFRHELRHVQRRDVDTKIMLAFFEAVCWFNPLMWLASRRAIADMELSCDEMVVYGKDEGSRKQYANLLLDTAGDDRGFSTCLSASAKTLRYRLKNVVQQRKRLSGTFLLGIMTAVLVMSTGMVTVTANFGSVNEVILQPAGVGKLESVTVKMPDARGYTSIYGWDEEALLSCLADVPVTWIGREMDNLQEAEQELLLVFPKESGGFLRVDIMDDTIQVSGYGSDLYQLDAPLDWEQIWNCLDFEAEDPDPPPVRPELYMWFEGVNPDEPMHADSQIISWTDEEGVYIPEQDPISWGGIGGFDCKSVTLQFTYDAMDWSIMVDGLNGEEQYSIVPKGQNDYTLELAPYSARYAVSGAFLSNRNTIYNMKFYFEVELPDERTE